MLVRDFLCGWLDLLLKREQQEGREQGDREDQDIHFISSGGKSCSDPTFWNGVGVCMSSLGCRCGEHCCQHACEYV